MGNTLSENLAGNEEYMKRLEIFGIKNDARLYECFTNHELKPSLNEIDFKIAVEFMKLYVNSNPELVLKECYTPRENPIFDMWGNATQVYVDSGRPLKIKHVIKCLSNSSGISGSFVAMIQRLKNKELIALLRYLEKTPIPVSYGAPKFICHFAIARTRGELEKRRFKLVNSLLDISIGIPGIISMIFDYGDFC